MCHSPRSSVSSSAARSPRSAAGADLATLRWLRHAAWVVTRTSQVRQGRRPDPVQMLDQREPGVLHGIIDVRRVRHVAVGDGAHHGRATVDDLAMAPRSPARARHTSSAISAASPGGCRWTPPICGHCSARHGHRHEAPALGQWSFSGVPAISPRVETPTTSVRRRSSLLRRYWGLFGTTAVRARSADGGALRANLRSSCPSAAWGWPGWSHQPRVSRTHPGSRCATCATPFSLPICPSS
jgi:hypothetical protein